MKHKFLSKLCKENNPEACQDCQSIKCNCTCHTQDIYIETPLENLLSNDEILED